MFSPGPDQWITALELNSPIVNDLGVDDLIAVEKLKTILIILRKIVHYF